MDGFCAKTGKQREMMRFTGRTGLHHQTGRRATTCANQMQMDCRRSEQGRDRHLLGVHLSVGHDQDVVARFNRIHRLCTHRCQAHFHAVFTQGHRIANVQFVGFEITAGVGADVAQFGDV